MGGRTTNRLRMALVAAATLLVVGPSLSGGTPQISGAVLASGSDFSVTGTVSNLAPGLSSTLSLSVDNPQSVQLTITQVTISVSSDPAGCSAVGNLSVDGASFTGNPPAATISGSPLPQTVAARSGNNDGSATIALPILVARSSGNGCQNVTFPFVYSARATYTAATTTAVGSSANPSTFGQPVTFTGTVTATPGSANPAVGTLTFYRCTSPANLAAGSPASSCTSAVALGAPQTLNGSGQATLTTSSLPAGSLPVYAVFTPTDSTSYSASSSTTITQTVGFTQPCITQSQGGSLTVGAGQAVCIGSGGKVGGGLTVQNGGSLYLNGGTVSGSFTANHAGTLTICGSTISGGATITASSGFVTAGDGNDDGAPACAGNTISGGLTISNGTGSFEAGGNSITGGATFTGNTGTGPYWQDAAPEVEGNHITGGLSCSGNNPAPTNGGQPNSVSGSRSGQCGAGGF